MHILAVGFMTPAFFFAGVGLASIPIIIHFLNRRRFKTVPWAAMDFLLRAMKKNRRRLKFEQWLLLATRCLVMLLVATALARPLWRNSAVGAFGQRTGLHVFVIDNSYSMAYEANRPDARTHLDRAKALARQQIARLFPGGESVAVIVASRPAAATLATPTYDLNAASVAVDHVQQSFAGTDIAGALRLAQEIGRADKNSRKQLYLITDGTRSAWDTGENQAVAQLGRELAGMYRIAHFNLGLKDQWNQAVVALRPGGNLVTSRFNNDFLATARAFGSGPDPVAQWKLDDATLPGGAIHLADGNQTITQPAVAFRDGGAHAITLTLAGEDKLKLDNTRQRVVNVAAALKVLIVEGERGVGRLSGSGAFLQLALAPPKENEKSDSYVAPELISDLELANKTLADYRAVILTSVAQLTSQQADQVAAFVKQGGTLLVFLGEPVSADNYNSVLLARGLMPGALTKRVNAPAEQSGFGFDFAPRGNLHPLLKVFEGEENSGLSTAQVFTYWQMDVKPQAKAERVLDYLPAKDPAITLHNLGQGRVVVVTTTANAEWTSLPAKPAYVALMHELLAGSVSAGDAWLNLEVGQRVEVPASVKLTAAPSLADASGREIVMEAVSGDGPVSWRSGSLDRPGLYRMTAGSARVPIAVNVPGEEADVRVLENAAIRRALGDVEVDLEQDQLRSDGDVARAGEDFGWPIMLVALALVGAECFMAMRFGHYRRM